MGNIFNKWGRILCAFVVIAIVVIKFGTMTFNSFDKLINHIYTSQYYINWPEAAVLVVAIVSWCGFIFGFVYLIAKIFEQE